MITIERVGHTTGGVTDYSKLDSNLVIMNYSQTQYKTAIEITPNGTETKD